MDTLHNENLLAAIARMQAEDGRSNRELVLDLIITTGEFLSPVEILPSEGEGQNIQFALLQNQEGQPYFPAFTGWEELRKLCGPKNQQTLMLTFDHYAGMVLRDNRAAGLVIDPFGCCLSFDREMLSNLVQRKAQMSPPQ